MATQTSGSGSNAKVLFLWALVGIPLLWGVGQTFIKGLALFS